MDNYYQVSPIIEKIVLQERPKTILEISGYNGCYCKLFIDCLLRFNRDACSVDRVLLDEEGADQYCDIYERVFTIDALANISSMEKYDMIFITHLLENLEVDDAIRLLKQLQEKVNKQILVLTPEYPYDMSNTNGISNVRAYHPMVFLGLDFSYMPFYSSEGNWQLYSFYKKHDYEEMEIDQVIDNTSRIDKLRIAYILPHQELTGGMKALLHQMKHLTQNGHIVKAYIRSNQVNRAIPEWSELKDDDISEQIVVPIGSLYLDFIDEVDIIILGWVSEMHEFVDAQVPVVLWEQGSEMIYGDYGDLLASGSAERELLSTIYRYPINLLAVSETIVKALKGKYNRSSLLFPACIDVSIYKPGKKDNNVPVVLLVGNPALSFKNFDFAFRVLEIAWGLGSRFAVHWACQSMPQNRQCSFPIKHIVMPSQEVLAELYRQADLFLSTSLYESFPLPPIEAMASGTAVLATDNGGIWMYAEPGVNCLLVEQGDAHSMANALVALLENPEQLETLAMAGVKTAEEFSFEKGIKRLEECLYKIIQLRKKDEF